MFEAHGRPWERDKYRIVAAGNTLLFLIGLWQFSAADRKEIRLQLSVEANETISTWSANKAANVDLKNNPRAPNSRICPPERGASSKTAGSSAQ